jgi:hypothetical protein
MPVHYFGVFEFKAVFEFNCLIAFQKMKTLSPNSPLLTSGRFEFEPKSRQVCSCSLHFLAQFAASPALPSPSLGPAATAAQRGPPRHSPARAARLSLMGGGHSSSPLSRRRSNRARAGVEPNSAFAPAAPRSWARWTGSPRPYLRHRTAPPRELQNPSFASVAANPNSSAPPPFFVVPPPSNRASAVSRR